MLKVEIVLAVAIAVQVFAAPAHISPSLKHSLKTKGSVNVFVTLKNRPSTVLNKINSLSFATREQRLVTLGSSLKQHASASQLSILEILASKPSVTVKSFWISNQVLVNNVDAELLAILAARSDVLEVTEDASVPLEEPVAPKIVQRIAENEWGIERIRAPMVWANGNTGIGVLVANIDTGVRYTHQDLKDNFAGDYGWFDPYFGTPTPDDQNGHGTHTMGTIVGKNGIGVAPGATWAACRGCDKSTCTVAALLECAEFVTCPTLPDGSNADCTKAPRLVSNSWASSRDQGFADYIVAAWKAAGIIGIFAIGNSRNNCNSVSYPADKHEVIGVGSTTKDETLSYFSSVGPSGVIIKPDIAAPGSDVRSAHNTNDQSYATGSGTSMAASHTAGVVALILSAHPDHDFAKVTEALYSGATHTVASTGGNCGGIPDTQYPNNYVGYGRLSAIGSLP